MIDKTIVALDFPDLETTKKFVDQVDDRISFVKVGMQLFYSDGKKVIEYLKSKDLKIFLDLKLHDIPSTVAKTLRVIESFEIEMTNVHVLGGSEMLEKAKDALNKTLLLGVTILTSHHQESIKQLNLEQSIEGLVKSYHNLAHDTGLSGIVCSAKDLEFFEKRKGFLYVTPGIRLNENLHDQKRVVKPCEAFQYGSTHIVMGREITTSPEPRKFLDQLQEHYERHC